MRLVPVVVLLVPACAWLQPAPPTCDDAACAEICEAERARSASLVQPGGEVLSAYEVALLAPLRDQVSAGARFAGDDALVLCRGVERCDEVLAPDPAQPLPAGTYVVRLKLELPPVGTWPVTVLRDCRHDGEEPAVTRTLELSARDGAVVLDPLETFVAPVAATVPAQCLVRVDAGPGKVAELRFALVPSGRAPRAVEPLRP